MDWLFRNFGKIWVLAALVQLALVGVAVWAVITLVNHFT